MHACSSFIASAKTGTAQRLCFRYIDSTISLLTKSEISSLEPSSVAVQPGLCQTWSETGKTGFRDAAHILYNLVLQNSYTEF